MQFFRDFYGNRSVAQTLGQMIAEKRIPQTILLSGPEGIGKATLARRFAAALVGDAAKVERDDLSLPQNLEIIEQREKWPSDKRAEDPLLFSTHPDFVTFAPEGPLRQITMQQMRALKTRAQFKPLHGTHRVFLIDHLDRANEQSLNSLLKILEEPPEHLVVIATTEHLHELLPTIRSRSLILQMGKLSDSEMNDIAAARNLPDAEDRLALSEGSPGLAVTVDIGQFRERRALILAALECGAGVTPFSRWVQHSESFAARKSEKLDLYLKLAYGLIEDVLSTWEGRPPARNHDVQERIRKIAQNVSFRWIECAVLFLDELVQMVHRNIQKVPALDALVVNLRNHAESAGT